MLGPRGSLGARLLVGAAMWIVVALGVTGVVLSSLFRGHAEETFQAGLVDHLAEILSFVVVDADGRIDVPRHPVDPQFNRPFSGWYWQVMVEGRMRARSRSLWDEELRFEEVELAFPRDRVTAFATVGPREVALRGVGRTFTMPGSKQPFVIVITGPAVEVDGAVGRFSRALAIGLVVLGLGLIGAALLQVRFGLGPLLRMRSALAEIRDGRRTRLEGEFPEELRPLAQDLNALLDHNAQVVERARTQTGNLAHALKTPLAALINELDRLEGPGAVAIRHQVAILSGQIDRCLSRARAVGAYGVPGAHVGVLDVAEGLRRTLLRIHRGRPLDVHLENLDSLVFEGERQDLEEMLGNLMDNACKWARGRVRVGGVAAADGLMLVVEDDGPGIPVERLQEVMARGRRLDETVPGSGLGLAIVLDLAELHRGKLTLEPSSLGGVAATLRFPVRKK